jgi:NAD(P)-dependent dehydrogenase (short-subunit alcohol dehydrogenase family)
MKVEGSNFVVTGGASGLGEGTVRMLVEKGANVCILDFNEERGEALKAELGVAFFKCNVMDEVRQLLLLLLSFSGRFPLPGLCDRSC